MMRKTSLENEIPLTHASSFVSASKSNKLSYSWSRKKMFGNHETKNIYNNLLIAKLIPDLRVDAKIQSYNDVVRNWAIHL